MSTVKNWFDVDRKGLKQLQEGKPKTYVVRELLQNAFDENITKCTLSLTYTGYNKVKISVEDDSPVGFRDLTDAYTLFKETYKRKDAQKRGRFNLGEKQVFAICDMAEIITTKGGVIFDNNGRKTTNKKRDRGSIILVTLKMTAEELKECLDYALDIFIPENVEFRIIYVPTIKEDILTYTVKYKAPHKIFEASLKTEIDIDGNYRPTIRKTNVHVHKADGNKFLYEMGIPVCEIDCDYSIDVQQKVPLGADRESVQPAFLKELYAEVLNHTYKELQEENSSNVWVRTATTSNRINKEAIETVIEKRFGDKVAIFNPKDANANDEAISNGYRLVHGREFDGDEWSNIKKFELIESSSSIFGKIGVGFQTVEPTKEQSYVGLFCKNAFKDIFNEDLNVEFIESKADVLADFGNNTLRFNLSRINFQLVTNGRISQRMLDLIIHEFGHRNGHHTEHKYHEAITMMGAWFTYKALNDPNYFNI